MLTRHSARELSLQTLFNLDSRYDLVKISAENWIEVYKNILGSLYEDTEKDEFSENIILGIKKNLESINEIIIKATPDWGIEKTAIVDRNILRLAIYEMLFSDVDVPPRVAINEAIELAKTFGHKKSFKFISGVLGAIYEATGLKEKDTKDNKKKADKEYKNAPVEGKAGALVFSKKDGKIFLAFVHDMFGYWTLPKGSVEENDKDLEAAAKREIKEEIGIEMEILEKLGENTYRAKDDNNKPVNRAVVYFLAEAKHKALVLEKDNKGLNNAKWIEIEKVMDLKLYDDLSKIIEKGIEIIKKNNA